VNSMTAIRDCFLESSSADVMGLVMSVSNEILSRSYTGDYWGAGSSNNSGSRGNRHTTNAEAAGPSRSMGMGMGIGSRSLTRYQMVHRLVTGKLNAHKRLVEVVTETVR
jgi:hypothetical protein